MLLRPFVQIATGVLWSMSVWLVVGEDGESHLLLHPLLAYLVPMFSGSISVWFALD
jgi:hypothetical protein